MGQINLDDIIVSPLKRIPLESGDVLHAMKQTDSGYAGFGEAYFSWIHQGEIKGWKRHTQMTMNLVVPVGLVRFVFHAEDAKAFRVEEVGDRRYVRLSVPPNIWFGFQGLSSPQSLVLNIASILHDPIEAQRRPIADIDYLWK